MTKIFSLSKGLLALFIISFFAASAFAAPVNNPRATAAQKAAAQKATTQKAAAKKATQKKATKSVVNSAKSTTAPTTAERGQEQQLGLMPSELDELNHNVFHADADAIRGARDVESAIRYIPFITIINTAGFGSQFDMRGQGRLSANGVKLYINGIPSTPLDSYYNPMPINTIIPSLVQEIEVFPGSGAVMYGAGTKGGTINIITAKRQRPYFIVGAGYVNTMATKGNSFNAFAHASENFGSAISANAGLGFNQMGGPRTDDSQTNAQAVLGLTWNFALGQKIDFDADFYYGKVSTTPYNSLLDEDGIMNVMRDDTTYPSGTNQDGKQTGISNLPNFDANKENREIAGNGEVESTQIRLNTKIAYENELAEKLKFDAQIYYSLNSKKYDTYEMYLPYFVVGEYNREPNTRTYTWFLPVISNKVASFDGKSGDLHYLDQSGTTLTENKFGAKAKIDWFHTGGHLVFGLDGMYELSNRKAKNYLRHALRYGSAAAGQALYARIDSNIDINVATGAVFVIEKLNFGQNLSVMGGARYEMKAYDVKFKDEYSGGTIDCTSADPATCTSGNHSSSSSSEKDYAEDYGNFTVELTPVFKYSNTGSIFARGEYGYIAPPAWATINRIGYVSGIDRTNNSGNDTVYLGYNLIPTTPKLKSETYWTAELGWKETIGKRILPIGIADLDIDGLLFALNIFYTNSQNEFYFEGDMWSGMTYGNYEKSRRYGAELAMEQVLFNGGLSFNESFTYLKAQRFHNDEWSAMPYSYDYKATLGASIDVSGYLEIVDVGVSLWIQNSLYGNQNIYTRKINVLGMQNQIMRFSITDAENDKLDPYLISDLGISIGINKNAAVITVGVKNVFDQFYYDYYNNDRSAVVNENRYVVGRGRTVFVEGSYRY